MYDDKRMYQWDNENALEYAEEKGIEKGIEQGIEKGMLSVAATMKNLGYPFQEIADITGLPLEQIESL